MEWEGSLMPLFWLLLLVFVLQAVLLKLKWLRIPSILVYIFLGMLLANSGLLELRSGGAAWLHGLSSLGLFYLMFLSGLEIDLDLLRIRKGSKLREHPVVLGLLLFAGSAGLSYLLGLRMAQIDPAVHAWMIMLILSTTSLGIVMPVLREYGLLRSRYGQTLLTAAFIADLLTMLLLSVVAGLYQSGFTWRQASVGLLLPLLVICYQAAARLRQTRLWQEEQGQPPSAFKLQAVFAVLGLYGILTDLTGAEPILGGFLAGLLLASFRIGEQHPVRQQLEGIGYGFIIPVFFMMVGAQFNVRAFLASPQALAWVPLLVGTAYIVKIVPMAGAVRALGLRMALAGGFLLSSRMTLVIVAASIGIRLGVIPLDLQDALIVMAMLTSLLSPLIFTLGHRADPAR